MKAVIYARVSSKEQAEGHSLAAQLHLLAEYASKKNLAVARKFSAPESASGAKERKLFAEMLEFVKKNQIPIILFEKIDRSTRNLKEAVILDEWLNEDPNRQTHYIKENLIIHKNSKSSEQFTRDLFVIIARRYISNLSEEVKKGQAEAVRDGLFPGTAKVGYTCPSAKSGRSFGQPKKPHPVEAPKIRQIFEKLARGDSTDSVFRFARDEAKLKNTLGGVISRTRFYELIRDPFYCGQFVWSGRLFDNGAHEAIVSKKIFYAAQDILLGRKNPPTKTKFYLFAGLVRDRETGEKLGATTNKGIAYYRFRGRRGTAYFPEKTIDGEVQKFLKKLKITKKGKAAFLAAMKNFLKNAETERDRARSDHLRQIARLDQLLASAELKYFEEKISFERFDFHRTKIEKEKSEIWKKIPAEEKEKNDSVVRTIAEFVELLKLLKKGYSKLPPEGKAQIAKILLSNIFIDGTSVLPEAKKSASEFYNLPRNDVWLGRRGSNPRHFG